MDKLLSDIEAFCDRHKISEWQFGANAIGDRHLIRQLRKGRDLRLSTLSRIEQYLANDTPTPESATARGLAA